MTPESSESELYPLYNTTFTLHRLSPLYTGSNLPLNNLILRQHARRFREILNGEIMRGVRVGLASEGNPVSAAGTLKTVTWRLLPMEEIWNPEQETQLEGNDDTTQNFAACRGMRVTVEYEKNIYSAIVLRDRREDHDRSILEDGDGFEYFPLLLTKMPGSLREVFVNFLNETFDARVSNLHLSSKYITDAFEKYISDVGSGEDGEETDFAERSRFLRAAIKETEIFVGFNLPGGTGALKTMEIHIMREDLTGLVARGTKIRSHGEEDSPFVEALTTYVKGHLALDLKHESVRIIRIACGAFVLGGEGRIKLPEASGSNEANNPRSRATRALINELIRTATGGGQLGLVP